MSDEADTEEVLSHVQPAHSPQWERECGTTRNVASAIRDSAPGPHRLPYSWWAIAPPAAPEVLETVADSMRRGEAVSEVLRESVTVMPPKSEVLDDVETVRHSADSIRPYHIDPVRLEALRVAG